VHGGAEIGGLVTSVATGDPLPDVSVFLYYGNGLRFTALTDDTGNYRVEHVRLGEYTVALASATTVDAAIVNVTDIDGAVYTANLQYAAAATLTGTVTDSSGQPLVGAAVSLRQGGEFIIANRTDETGGYTFLLSAAAAVLVATERQQRQASREAVGGNTVEDGSRWPRRRERPGNGRTRPASTRRLRISTTTETSALA
jgi:hypothetical protein